MAMWRDKNFLANQHHFTKEYIALKVLFYLPFTYRNWRAPPEAVPGAAWASKVSNGILII